MRQSAEENPQLLIKNLEGFLERFPASVRREQVMQRHLQVRPARQRP